MSPPHNGKHPGDRPDESDPDTLAPGWQALRDRLRLSAVAHDPQPLDLTLIARERDDHIELTMVDAQGQSRFAIAGPDEPEVRQALRLLQRFLNPAPSLSLISREDP
ncbi:hypothetical protein [Marinicauda sp. Alg238-R41]|jgi:hypothetical protein|uniref:hypothetical protein n=1 Tax=Marinicauda sp. Alg238-R41 TaxID=2993447 RepID=UPI0022E75470|nr:hypothetical protein [Marinicauda sp. Alg238-R41]